MSSFSGVTFVLFRFRIFAFIEAAALCSIVLRYACAPTVTRSYLTSACVLFRFIYLFFVSLEISLFPSTFVPLPYSLCMESTSYVFLFRMIFLPCGHGLDFCHLMWDFSQSMNRIDHILRRERRRGNIHVPCSVDHGQDWQPWPVDLYSCYMYVWPYIHTHNHTHTQQPATQTNRDPNRDRTLARSNYPRTSETYRRQDDSLYELQFLLSSGVLLVFQNLNYKLQRMLSDVCMRCPSSKVIKSDNKQVSSSRYRRVTRRQVMRHFTSNDTDHWMSKRYIHQTSLLHIDCTSIKNGCLILVFSLTHQVARHLCTEQQQRRQQRQQQWSEWVHEQLPPTSWVISVVVKARVVTALLSQKDRMPSISISISMLMLSVVDFVDAGKVSEE